MLETLPYAPALEGLAAGDFWPTRFAAENFGLALNRRPVCAAARQRRYSAAKTFSAWAKTLCQSPGLGWRMACMLGYQACTRASVA
jgi:hypothetical protein